MSENPPTPLELPEAQLSVGEIADALGIKPTTVSNYATRGYMPTPDGYVGRTPWWWESTVREWVSNRPGLAWRKGQRSSTPEGASDEA